MDPKIGIPDHFGGKPIPDDAIEIALAAEKKKKDGNEGGETQGEAPSLDGFIYVPSISLYFTKERTLLDHKWDDTHRELHKQNLKMPTIPQFVEFLKYLRADPTAENTRVYNEITETRDLWRSEWLDARFYAKGDELWVAYNHIVDVNLDLVAQDHEKLEGHLMQDKKPGISLEYWLDNSTKQGLPPADAKQGNLRYGCPRENSIVRFHHRPVTACLDCNMDPSESGSYIGVRAVRTRTQKLGGKQ